ncbi:protein ALP1-like isoform X2 [Centruroides sculpturatus]|uniref:protein ALP1-like isoform X2 n=1 Tax=Centruroides sculpturatus TaxID=218467 RepID=UPI000C6E0D74|nr:protein ALP1-like isoform X2 [Centruroides sculpturatus]
MAFGMSSMTTDEILALLDEYESDEEAILLYHMTKAIPVTKARMNLNEMTDSDCLLYFRFSRDDLFHLHSALRLPSVIICKNGSRSLGIDALCIFLRRLVYPNRLDDISVLLGRTKSELSRFVHEILNIIYNSHSKLLSNIDEIKLTREKLKLFSQVITAKDAPLTNCWGFIHGTEHPICRPKKHQRVVFSDRKRTHCLKFQSVVTPDGMIANLFGPLEGRRHDSGMLRESNLLEHLAELPCSESGTQFVLYGVSGYPLRQHLITPFRGASLTPEQQEFNSRMSSVRECVEWVFGKIVQTFPFLDLKKNCKLFLQPVGKLYIVGALLTNCHTCLYGSATSDYFNCLPPKLDKYLECNQ